MPRVAAVPKLLALELFFLVLASLLPSTQNPRRCDPYRKQSFKKNRLPYRWRTGAHFLIVSAFGALRSYCGEGLPLTYTCSYNVIVVKEVLQSFVVFEGSFINVCES